MTAPAGYASASPRRTFGLRRSAAVLALSTFLLLPKAVPAQGADKVVPLDGTQAFRQILSFAGLQPVESVAAFGEKNANEALLIVLGSPAALDNFENFPRGLSGFINRGVAVLIACEQPDEGRLDDIGVTIHGDTVSDPFSNYVDQWECPLVTPTPGSRHAVFEKLPLGLAANKPAYLTSNKLPILGVFSEHARPTNQIQLDIRRQWRRHPLAFAVGTPDPPPGPGRILVLAGYGQFTNGMMLRFDNDNFDFAWNCVRWLRQTEGGGKRKYALLIEEGKIVDKFEGPLAITIPRVSLTNVLNRFLDQLQREDFFNELLRRVPRDWLLRGVVVIVTVLLLVFGRRWLMRARHRLETEAPLVDLTVEGMLAELPPLSRRHRAMMSSGNFYDAARALARHFFELRVGHAGFAGGPLPAVNIRAGWSSRRLRADLEWLWDLAYGATPTAVSSTRLACVIRTCHTLDAAVANGTLLFDAPDARKVQFRGAALDV